MPACFASLTKLISSRRWDDPHAMHGALVGECAVTACLKVSTNSAVRSDSQPAGSSVRRQIRAGFSMAPHSAEIRRYQAAVKVPGKPGPHRRTSCRLSRRARGP